MDDDVDILALAKRQDGLDGADPGAVGGESTPTPRTSVSSTTTAVTSAITTTTTTTTTTSFWNFAPGLPTTSSTTTSATTTTPGLESPTTSPTLTPTPSPSDLPTNIAAVNPPSTSGVSNGALAGAIVGSVIGTAILTLLAAWLFFRRRHQPPPPPPKGYDTQSVPLGPVAAAGGKRGGGGEGPVFEKSMGGFPLAAIIPEPADDDAVRTRILTLFDHISLHVDNYYPPVATPPTLSPDMVDMIAQYDSGLLPASLLTLLDQRAVQRQVMTHVLVKTLVEAIQPRGQLLPTLFAAIPQVRGISLDNTIFAWRMISAHLYQKAQYENDPVHIKGRAEAARTLAIDFTSAFAPYSAPNYNQTERLTHLTNLAKMTAELGVWLFAHPCRFEFDYTGMSRNEPFIVPRVVKVCDENGKRLGTVQVVVSGSTVRL